MKRALQVVGQNAELPRAEPEVLIAGQRVVVIEDSGDGAASRHFATCMVDAGAQRVENAELSHALRIWIEANAPAGRDVEHEPDFILGSARPAFARHLVARLAADAKR